MEDGNGDTCYYSSKNTASEGFSLAVVGEVGFYEPHRTPVKERGAVDDAVIGEGVEVIWLFVLLINFGETEPVCDFLKYGHCDVLNRSSKNTASEGFSLAVGGEVGFYEPQHTFFYKRKP